MDGDPSHNAFSPPEDVNAFESETEPDNSDVSKGFSFDGDRMRELDSAGEVLTRVELDIACSCEKLVNLTILVMHVETKESEIEALVSDPEHRLSDSGQKTLEFDLLSAILDSEVKELESFMCTLQMDIVKAREILSSCKYLGETLMGMEDKLDDSEKSLQQSLKQISEIKLQSANLQRFLLSFTGEENWGERKGAEFLGNGVLSDLNEKIKMQTAEQQRHILRMLEKSLARELDLEKKVTESRQIEDDLKLRLHSTEQEVLYVEEEAELVLERLFESDNASEVLTGVSKELLEQLRLLKFNQNGSLQREGELSSKLRDAIEQLTAKDSALKKVESSNAELVDPSRLKEVEEKLAVAESQTTDLKDKVSLLEKKLKESELHQLNAKASADETGNMVKDLEQKVFKAEIRAESAEAKCKLLTETTIKELNEELILVKSSGNARVNSLEKQLRESEIQLQNAVASAEASLEKQSMLYLSINDMENVIADLKSKVLKAESQTDSAEDKCIILSESNAELRDELSFLKSRVENLEESLRKTEETKKATAKDISLRTKLITDLILQLALERERLQMQISSLKEENKTLVKQSKQADKGTAAKMSHDGKGSSTEYPVSKVDLRTATCAKESKEGTTKSSSTSFEADKKADSVSEFETTRNIDARQLNFKFVSLVVLILLIPVIGGLLHQHLDREAQLFQTG